MPRDKRTASREMMRYDGSDAGFESVCSGYLIRRFVRISTGHDEIQDTLNGGIFWQGLSNTCYFICMDCLAKSIAARMLLYS